ncbi:hypothetical protein MRX96_047806 [Rhipicephalus microplus]
MESFNGIKLSCEVKFVGLATESLLRKPLLPTVVRNAGHGSAEVASMAAPHQGPLLRQSTCHSVVFKGRFRRLEVVTTDMHCLGACVVKFVGLATESLLPKPLLPTVVRNAGQVPLK